MNSRGEPVGLSMLGAYSMGKIMDMQYSSGLGFDKLTAKIGNYDLDYYVDSVNGVIITNPVTQDATFKAKHFAPSIAEVEQHLKTIPAYQNFRLIAPVIGGGLLEDHIVTVSKNKVADDQHFIINSKGQRTFKLNAADNVIELGTQSVFDRASCGYHVLMNTNICYELFCKKNKDSIEKNYPAVTSDDIDDLIRKKNGFVTSVEYGLALHQQAKEKERQDNRGIAEDKRPQPIKSPPDLSLAGHLYNAYRSTYYTSASSEQPTRYWWNPFNLPELFLKVVKESFAWAADRIHANANRSSGARQIGWSFAAMLLHGVQLVAYGVSEAFNKVATTLFKSKPPVSKPKPIAISEADNAGDREYELLTDDSEMSHTRMHKAMGSSPDSSPTSKSDDDAMEFKSMPDASDAPKTRAPIIKSDIKKPSP